MPIMSSCEEANCRVCYLTLAGSKIIQQGSYFTQSISCVFFLGATDRICGRPRNFRDWDLWTDHGRNSSWPWLVSIGFWASLNQDWKHHCAGTLLSSTVVLTARGCFEPNQTTSECVVLLYPTNIGTSRATPPTTTPLVVGSNCRLLLVALLLISGEIPLGTHPTW